VLTAFVGVQIAKASLYSNLWLRSM